GGADRRGENVFELERHHIDRLSERADRVDVVVRGGHFDVGDLTGWRVVFGGEGVNAITEAARRHGEHAAKLPSAEDPDGRAGQDHSCWARTSAAVSSRYFCSAAR